MYISIFFMHIRDRPQIPIISAAWLPEPMRHRTVSMRVDHAGEEIRCILLGPRCCSTGQRAFQLPQNRLHPNTCIRQQNQMNVFGHNDICPEVKRGLSARSIYCLKKPFRHLTIPKKRLLSEAGECQTMGVSLDVPCFSGSSYPLVHEQHGSRLGLVGQGWNFNQFANSRLQTP